MCGRYAFDKDVNDLIVDYVAQGGKATDWRPSFSIAPTDPVPIVRERSGDEGVEREIELASWGIKPPWFNGAHAPINARLESVAEKPMFRSAFQGKRAIVPMTGYYEWTADGKIKLPHFISNGGELLSAAGLYEVRKAHDNWLVTFTIITRSARDASGEVHDRMPVFLTPDVWDQWLSPDKLTAAQNAPTLAMLESSSIAVAATLTTYRVDRKVNSVRTVDPADATLIRPVDA
ncbi:SOS response-associated peptidase [soil metagenome]